jgi:D-tyrosyl-tRNA(Tyr) deacylase
LQFSRATVFREQPVEGVWVKTNAALATRAPAVEPLVEKIAALRIFDDEAGKMNLSLKDRNGGMLIVSQFTLYGDVRRGLRPSWIDAAAPEVAEPLYDFFVRQSRTFVDEVATGSFRAMMEVELVNDGPVTILLDSKKLF